MGLVWLAQCSELWIIGRRISPGIEKEIRKAKEWGIPVKHYVFKRDLEKKLLDSLLYPDVEFFEMNARAPSVKHRKSNSSAFCCW